MHGKSIDWFSLWNATLRWNRFKYLLKNNISHQTFVSMKTSWRHLEDAFHIRLQKTSSRPLAKTPSRHLQDAFKKIIFSRYFWYFRKTNHLFNWTMIYGRCNKPSCSSREKKKHSIACFISFIFYWHHIILFYFIFIFSSLLIYCIALYCIFFIQFC